MRSARQSARHSVMILTVVDDSGRVAFQIGDDSRFAPEAAVREVPPPGRWRPQMLPPRDHIEEQSLEHLNEARRLAEAKRIPVSDDLMEHRWQEWMTTRPDPTLWGAAQRMRCRTVHEWVRELIR